jgi:hypothetical protein
MQNLTKIRSFSLALCASMALATSAPAFAQHGGGHVGGGHGGYGGWHGGYGGWHGGYGGWHGGYGGWHGGYGGWRGGWYGGYRGWYGGWGPWGWGGLGLGLYFATLPYYYSTYWWGGVPYYYADYTYYRWDPGVGQYETVAPPAEVQDQIGAPGAVAAGGATASSGLIAYPKNGQSEEQLGKDKFECHRWAVGQTGFDPTEPRGGAAPGNRSNYLRAQAACLEGRGYSVK